MGVLLTLIAGLVVWVVLWALGVKSFHAFMITMLMLVLAAAGYMPRPAPARPAPAGLESVPCTPRFAGSTQSAELRLSLLRGRNGRAVDRRQIKPFMRRVP